MSYMQELVSQTFRLTEPQVDDLKAEAMELRINKSELLRRILDERRLGRTKKGKNHE